MKSVSSSLVLGLALLSGLSAVEAQTIQTDTPLLPERRLLLSQDVDFYGADLQALFDTDYTTCERLCRKNPDCAAFTFNQKSSACFPKSKISDRQAYDGAWSGEFLPTSVALQNNALNRLEAANFIPSRDLKRARQQAEKLGATHPAGHLDLKLILQRAAAQRAAGDVASAMRWTGAALSHRDQADLWVEYADLSLRASAQDKDKKRRYQARAQSAALNAYLRAQNPAMAAQALMLLADAYERQERGRDMIPVLKLAAALQPNWAEVQDQLNDARGKYGFRITEHDSESDSAIPRICATFSEGLLEHGQDYAPFVKRPMADLPVSASGNQLCVEGFAHGSRATLTFRSGLPAANGETLAEDVQITQYIRDRAPSARFPGRAYVLPKSPNAGLPIETLNIDRLELSLARVSDRNLMRAIQENTFGRPLARWEAEEFDATIAEQVWQGEAEVQNELNRDMTTRLPMGDIIADLPAGIYLLRAHVPGGDPYDSADASQWFVLSDLGVTTFDGADGLHVFVRALSTAEVIPDVKATLLSRSNRVLAEVTLDADGYGLFSPGLTRGTNGAEPALLIVENGEQDVTFLSLKEAAFDLSDRGVEGRAPSGAIDVFLSTGRGAYRAGETIHVTALSRDTESKAIPDLPLTAILTRPDGVEYSRHFSSSSRAGGHVFSLPLSPSVPRGSWRLSLYADPNADALASASVLVEDFLPERIDYDLTLSGDALKPGDTTELTVKARYLFGSPASDLAAQGRVVLRASDDVTGYSGYQFGRHDQRFSPISDTFSAPRTDAMGRVSFPLTLPTANTADRPLQAEVITTLAEGSGRPVERRMIQDLRPQQPIIGLKQMFEGVVPEGSSAPIQMIALGTDLTPVAMPVRWTLNRITTRYQWYQQWGNWEWEPITRREVMTRGTANLGEAPFEIEVPVDWGNYELVVEAQDNPALSASTTFYAGWYAPADTSQTPDTLELSLDRTAYRAGDTAKLRLVPRYAGKALITVLSNQVIDMRAVEVTEGENLIDLPVTDDWGAGAYVTASVIRPMDQRVGQNPARALGLSYAQVAPGERQLDVAIAAPKEAQPRETLQATVQVAGVKPDETAYVTVAAVDLGILNITGFDSPNPSAHYFGQRRLGVDVRDIYGRLINGMDGAMGQLRSGGDAGGGTSFQSPPPTEELLAYFTGPVTVRADGTAQVGFDLPSFNGTVRLMAIAWSDTGVGQAEADVLVRDPVVISASLPRFMAPDDRSRLLLDFVHTSGPAGEMDIALNGKGITLNADHVSSSLTLTKQGQATLDVPLSAQALGDHAIDITLTTPDGQTLTKTLTLPVRQNDPKTAVTRQFELAGGQSMILDTQIFAGLRPDSGSAVLAAGPLARFNVPALMTQLDQYPYGCTEQVTSQTLPLLYLSDISTALGLNDQPRLQDHISTAIETVLTRQARNGAFGLWQPDSGDGWLDAYVTDFLSRARAAGHDVPDLAFRMALDNLRNQVNYAADFDSGGEALAYALLVLAREGAASMGDLRYYADVKGDAFSTPMGAAQLGAALAQYGDQTRADAMFARAASQLRKIQKNDLWRADYGTDLRDTAAVLTLAVEAGSEAVDRQTLANRLAEAGTDRSTQESVWSLLAAHALVADPGQAGLRINGQHTTRPFLRMKAAELSTQPTSIANTSDQPMTITLTTEGVTEGRTDAGGYGYRIERQYYDTDGTPVDMNDAQTGDRLVAVVTVHPAEERGARLMINDPLPAGFEIDNPNLLRQGDIGAFDWLRPSETQMTEFRADRFLAAVDWQSDAPIELAYVIRAISPGDFHHPAAVVEDMYQPQYRANTASGRVSVMR